MPAPVMRRYILLGASNLTFGFPLVVEALARSAGARGSQGTAEGQGGTGEQGTGCDNDKSPIPNDKSTHPVVAINDQAPVTANPPVAPSPRPPVPSVPTPVPTTEILAAHGHGRSYRSWSHVLVRGLPGIVQCGLWEELRQRPPSADTRALITDVGNDLIYGCTPDEVLAAVRTCWDRLVQAGARVCFVRPPTERLLRLSEVRYRVTKKLFFPGPTPPWGQMKQYLIEVDEQLQQLARETGSFVVTPEPDWYGIDPIHIRRSRRPEAWERILNTGGEQRVQVRRPGLACGVRIWNASSSERTLLGRTLRRDQPVLTWPDGSSLSLF
jgi:hypothetical protein